jgi:c-di-GMP-binding flagellar brake protein YcgR
VTRDASGDEPAADVPPANRRAFFRAPIEWRGTYRRASGPADELAAFWALDLSATGAALELHGELPEVGESLELHFTASPRFQVEDLRLDGLVCNRRRPPSDRVFGIEFAALSEAQRDLMSRIVLTAQRLDLQQRRSQ